MPSGGEKLSANPPGNGRIRYLMDFRRFLGTVESRNGHCGHAFNIVVSRKFASGKMPREVSQRGYQHSSNTRPTASRRPAPPGGETLSGDARIPQSAEARSRIGTARRPLGPEPSRKTP
jgi:hypothetical protein